jgi:hypothetical protein
LETWNARNEVNGEYWSPFLFINCFGLHFSQWAPIVQIKYLMLDWTIYRLFLLNTGWKRDSLQILIFVYVCSLCYVVELEKRFETWIARNELNGGYCFHFSYFITVLALVITLKCAHNGHQLSKSTIVFLNGRYRDYLY